MNFFESTFKNIKRIKDELTDNVTPENYSQAEVHNYEARKNELDQKVLTEKEQEIINSIPTREELEIMKKEHVSKQQKQKDDSHLDNAA